MGTGLVEKVNRYLRINDLFQALYDVKQLNELKGSFLFAILGASGV